MRFKAFLPLLALPLMSCVVSYKVSPLVTARNESPPPRSVSITYDIKPVAEQARQSAPVTFVGYFLGVINLANPLIWAEYPAVPRPYVLADPWGNLQRRLGNAQLFLRATTTEGPPERGIHVSVDAVYFPEPESWMHPPCLSAMLSGVTLGIIPYYCDETGVKVRYDLYVNRQLKKSYQYEIRKKGLAGLLILPFAWLSLFTDDLADAIVQTTRQFIFDAAQDGFL